MSTSKNLGRAVLRDVSRSFYLSLRLLPRGFREPASVGYLLARLSDTIADAGEVSSEERKGLLNALTIEMKSPSSELSLWKRVGDLASLPGMSPGEEILLRSGREVFAWGQELPEEAWKAVQQVIEMILIGQQWDLHRFEGAGVTRLGRDEELETYCYQVAGCVGEFWTRLGFLQNSAFAQSSLEEMARMGRCYGQGLQLVNILRDLVEDLERGRCYLPGEGMLTEESLQGSVLRWQEQAEAWLDEGLAYCDRLSGFRVQVASGLPVLLGKLTLKRLHQASWKELKQGVKATRAEVRDAGQEAIWASLSKRSGRWQQSCEKLLKSAQS